jgi:hypothetical protein
MKAKDYYAHVKGYVWDEKDFHDYAVLLCKDALEMIKARKIERVSAEIAIVSEINQKHNALMRLFKKHSPKGEQPAMDDFFIAFLVNEEPELKKYFPQYPA